jgi:hypothetical protein
MKKADPFAKLGGWEIAKRQEDARLELQKKAKKPKRIIAINPVQIRQIYLAEISADPISFVGIRKFKPQKAADFLHDWPDKKNTLLVMVREPDSPARYYSQESGEPMFLARYMAGMIGRYRQAWHQPFVYPRLDSIAYALFTRRWPVDRNALAHRLRKEFGIHYGSGIRCPKEGHIALAAALITARAWQGAEWRFHSDTG